jgi:hypothetical protein
LAAAFVLAASLALAIAGPDSIARSATGQPSSSDLFLVGGSMLVKLANNYDVDGQFARLGWTTTHDAIGGRSIGDAISLIQTTRADTVIGARAMVIVLGINDRRKTPGEFIALVDELRTLILSLNADIRIYWVNMVVFHKTGTPRQAVHSVRVRNERLEEYAAAHGIRIIDWRRIADGATDYNRADGYHPIRCGQLKLLRLMKRRVGEAQAD